VRRRRQASAGALYSQTFPVSRPPGRPLPVPPRLLLLLLLLRQGSRVLPAAARAPAAGHSHGRQ